MRPFFFSLIFFLFLLHCGADQGYLRNETISNENPKIKIHFVCSEFEETKEMDSSLYEKQDLLILLAELSKKEDPSLRFISTNRTEEVMEVNGVRNTWKEGWVIYVNESKVDGKSLKRGIKVGVSDKIEVKFESVERVFGRPTESL